MYAVAVHAGAGFHSSSKEPLYNDLCVKACKTAIKVLKGPVSEHTALDAVTAAVSVLEDSYLTNAGFGSCLNFDGRVECEAGIMCGRSLIFTSVGSVSCIQNPILIPKKLMLSHLTGSPSPVGRVKPLSLCGDGAKRWASEEAGMPIIPLESLVSNEARRSWRKYRRIYGECGGELSGSAKRLHTELCESSDRLDTVGAICLDKSGNICAATSSGGIPLKAEGRLGQSAVYGCGAWAEVTPVVSVGCVTTGTGEQLIRTQLAQRIASSIMVESEDMITSVVSETFRKDFLESRFLSNEVTPKYGGVLGLRKVSGSEGKSFPSSIEIFCTHSTESLSYAFFVSNQMKNPFASVHRKTRSSAFGNDYYSFVCK